MFYSSFEFSELTCVHANIEIVPVLGYTTFNETL